MIAEKNGTELIKKVFLGIENPSPTNFQATDSCRM